MGKIWILLLLYSYCFSGCEATVNGEKTKNPHEATIQESVSVEEKRPTEMKKEIETTKNDSIDLTQEEQRQYAYAVQKGLKFQQEDSLIGIYDFENDEKLMEDFQSKQMKWTENGFHILLFTTMNAIEEELLLIPQYTDTKVELYELLTDEQGKKVKDEVPIYSYTLQDKDVILLRVSKESQDYLIRVSYGNEESEWIPNLNQEMKIPLMEYIKPKV